MSLRVWRPRRRLKQDVDLLTARAEIDYLRAEIERLEAAVTCPHGCALFGARNRCPDCR